MTKKKSPCPSTGPAHDGRGKGKGMSGGSRKGKTTARMKCEYCNGGVLC